MSDSSASEDLSSDEDEPISLPAPCSLYIWLDLCSD